MIGYLFPSSVLDEIHLEVLNIVKWSSDPTWASRNSIRNPTPLIKLTTRLLLMTTTNPASPVYQAAASIRILAFHFAGSVIVSSLIWEASLP
jgi:hypothetical protein